MDALTINYWRTQNLVEYSDAPQMKRFDTSPEVGVELSIGGNPFTLLGSNITGRVRFSVTLRQLIAKNTTRVRTSFDQRIVVDSILVIDSERLRVLKVDDASEAGTLNLTVSRGYANTQAAAHQASAKVSVFIAERPCPIIPSASNNQCYLPWQTGDLKVSGSYDIEFEIQDAGGRKFSVPTTSIRLVVTDDFDGA